MTDEIKISLLIPGEPYALKRHRTAVRGKHAIQYDPKENRDWKSYAATMMYEAMAGLDPMDGPVSLQLVAGFSMPKSRWRKKVPRPTEWHTKRPDLDNVIKAVKDAAKGILWHDDSQVATLAATKMTLEQGRGPYLRVSVRQLSEDLDELR
jgi:Holliday junction resolvase RusA-like endonuclease